MPFFVAVLALKMVPFFGPIIFIICIISVQLRRRKTSNSIAFMHPNASSRGGGERVLWMMIKALLEEKSKIQTVAIYIRDQDNLSLDDMLASTKKSFNIEIENKNKINVKLIKLKASQYADPHRYKFSTIIFEALGSCLATVEAIFKFCPEIYLDSTGYGFSLFLPRVLSGSKVLAYWLGFGEKCFFKNARHANYGLFLDSLP